MQPKEPIIIKCEDLESAIAEYGAQGFRLDMIFPADGPRKALMSRGDEVLQIDKGQDSNAGELYPQANADWVRGRAGMEYRDLIPDRLNGQVIASHIRLTEGGPVADYVHYHKIAAQLIYCLKGRIKVVYEDQGEPFWLEPGDSVVQPPEIRHRVLECEAGSEVLEFTIPAEHETWRDHEMDLPNSTVNRDRLFGGQTFHVTKAKAD